MLRGSRAPVAAVVRPRTARGLSPGKMVQTSQPQRDQASPKLAVDLKGHQLRPWLGHGPRGPRPSTSSQASLGMCLQSEKRSHQPMQQRHQVKEHAVLVTPELEAMDVEFSSRK